MSLSQLDKEAICLKAAVDSLDDLLSSELFALMGADPTSEIRFHEAIHQRLFNILLVDLVSPVDAAVVGQKGSLIDILTSIAGTPTIGNAADARVLSEAVREASLWLGQEVTIDVWLPTIRAEGVLALTRQEFICICGNIAKHGFARLTRVSRQIASILSRNGIPSSPEQGVQVLNDFYERFHSDILNYHGTTLAELLNNVRWGVHSYLEPAYRNALQNVPGQVPPFTFAVPAGVGKGLPHDCYWELLCAYRRGPNVRRFVGSKWFKLRY